MMSQLEVSRRADSQAFGRRRDSPIPSL